MNTEGYSAARIANMRAGCQRRDRAKRERTDLWVAALRPDHSHLLQFPLSRNAIYTALTTLAGNTDPLTPTGRALREALTLKPQALTQTLRRHPEVLTPQKAAAPTHRAAG